MKTLNTLNKRKEARGKVKITEPTLYFSLLPVKMNLKRTPGAIWKKSSILPMPIPNYPLEFIWWVQGKPNVFKTQTIEQGIVKINLIDDLKMTVLL